MTRVPLRQQAHTIARISDPCRNHSTVDILGVGFARIFTRSGRGMEDYRLRILTLVVTLLVGGCYHVITSMPEIA